MLTTDFNYDLPETAIAIYPPEERGKANLLVVDKFKQTFSDHKYADIVDYLGAGDVLVINSTKVFKARIFWPHPKSEVSGVFVETFFLSHKPDENGFWKVKTRKLKFKNKITLFSANNEFELELTKSETGEIVAQFKQGNAQSAFAELGQMPIPPYLKRDSTAADEQRYNPEFSKSIGSVAAPTASLNMTNELLAKIRDKGVQIVEVILHVGWGTFAPVQTEQMEDHQIHAEYYEVTAEARKALKEAKSNNKQIWVLGTTAARVVETIADSDKPNSGWTSIFIYPGYKWKLVSGLITNFHVPQSSLMALVASFMGSPDLLQQSYKHALDHGYKFLSYGDSMLIF